MNTTCTTVFSTGTDTDAICTGTCRDLFDAIISSCNATVSQTILLAIYLNFKLAQLMHYNITDYW